MVVTSAVGETDAVALAVEDSVADALVVAEDSEDFEEHAARSAAVPRPRAGQGGAASVHGRHGALSEVNKVCAGIELIPEYRRGAVSPMLCVPPSR